MSDFVFSWTLKYIKSNCTAAPHDITKYLPNMAVNLMVLPSEAALYCPVITEIKLNNPLRVTGLVNSRSMTGHRRNAN